MLINADLKLKASSLMRSGDEDLKQFYNRPSSKPIAKWQFCGLCSSNTFSILWCSTALLLKTADHK